MIVDYHPATEKELREIVNFYDDRVPGLGQQFLNEFERDVLKIAATPERWMIVEGDVRRFLMKRFPFIIYFRKTASSRIRITSVKHEHRHPDYGRNRK